MEIGITDTLPKAVDGFLSAKTVRIAVFPNKIRRLSKLVIDVWNRIVNVYRFSSEPSFGRSCMNLLSMLESFYVAEKYDADMCILKPLAWNCRSVIDNGYLEVYGLSVMFNYFLCVSYCRQLPRSCHNDGLQCYRWFYTRRKHTKARELIY